MNINQLSLLDTQEEKDNRCVVLLRVSTKDQVEGHSLGAQKSTAYRYADKNNLKIVKVFEFHESASKSKERVIFDTVVLPFIRENNIPHVEVEKTDRLARNFSDSGKLEDLVENHGLCIHLIKENMVLHKNSSAHDKAMFGHKVVEGRNFGHNLAEEITKAYKQKVESGLPANNYPYGYKYNCKTKELLVDKKQADVVRKIYHLYVTGKYSFLDIADMLNEEGISSPSQDKDLRSTSKWAWSSVKNILTRPNYYGDFWGYGVLRKGSFESIITHDIYKKCQKIWEKQRRKRKLQDPDLHPYKQNIFTDLLENTSGKRAALCCKIYQPNRSSQKHIYPYYKVSFILGRGRCKKVTFTEQSLYEAVDKAMSSMKFEETSEQRVHKVEQDIFARKQELQKLRQETKDTINLLRAQRSKLISLYTENTISKQELDEQREILAAKIAENHKKLPTIRFTRQEKEGHLLYIKYIHEFDNKHKLYLAAQSKEEKLAVLNSLVESIIVDQDRSIKICFKHPYTFIAPISGHIIKATCNPRARAILNLSKKKVPHKNQSSNQIVNTKSKNRIYNIFKSIISSSNQTPLVKKSFDDTT